MIQYTELLCEMVAARRSERARWRVVLLLEVVKAVCRLWLLRLTRLRPLLSRPLPEREMDPGVLQEEEDEEEEVEEESDEASTTRPIILEDQSTTITTNPPIPPITKTTTMTTTKPWLMPRTGLTLPALPRLTTTSSDDIITTTLLTHVLTLDDLQPPPALLHQIRSLRRHVAELLYILRPVVYVLALRYYSTSRNGSSGGAARKNRRNPYQSWTPWLLGLGIDFAARRLASPSPPSTTTTRSKTRTTSSLERTELAHRTRLLVWWFLRGAFYQRISKYVLPPPSFPLFP